MVFGEGMHYSKILLVCVITHASCVGGNRDLVKLRQCYFRSLCVFTCESIWAYVPERKQRVAIHQLRSLSKASTVCSYVQSSKFFVLGREINYCWILRRWLFVWLAFTDLDCGMLVGCSSSKGKYSRHFIKTDKGNMRHGHQLSTNLRHSCKSVKCALDLTSDDCTVRNVLPISSSLQSTRKIVLNAFFFKSDGSKMRKISCF